MSFFIHTLEALVPSRDRRRRTREQELISIPSQAAPVTPSLSMQPLTPPSSSANVNETAGLSQSHSLLDANNVLIRDGEFNQIHGHQANVVIHINRAQSSSGSPSGPPSGPPHSNDSDHINPTPSSGQSTHQSQTEPNYEMVSLQTQEIPLQRSNDIYERHLTPKGRGFPLWIPGPNQVLHIDYRRTGIRIGDVGIITHSGGFSFLFNICLPRNDPVNPRVLPEHFAPILPPIEATDVDEFMAFENGSHLASASINRLQTDTDISFESSASEGAILTMPRGARSEDLGNFARFREYAAANIADWYKFVNGPHGREAKNGDVRLVVGFDKTTFWGMATFANHTRQNNCRLTFRPLEGAGLTTPPSTYMWEYSGVAEVRAGPGSNQNDGLRMDNDPPDVQFENQCLFMRTLNITLADNVWADIHSSLGSVHVDSRNNQKYPPVKDYSSHSSNLGTTSSSLSSQGVQSGTPRTASLLHGANVDARLDDNPTMFISGPLGRIMDHPSKVLNDILLAKNPTAKMVITHDNDWSSFITQYDTLPDLHEVASNILSSQDICEDNGVIFLQPKDIMKEVLAGSVSANPVKADSKIQAIQAKFYRFRILVIGRANAGKTTILQRLCNTTGEPMVFNPKGEKIELSALNPSLTRGLHDIENQMIFKSHPGFIFHDSCGFESGNAHGLKVIQDFIKQCSKARDVNDLLHAIWYCIPTSDDRPITAAEKMFFNEYGTGIVPVIVLWTKTDSLDLAKIKQLMKEGTSWSEAMEQAPHKAWADFEKDNYQRFHKFKYPPKAYVVLRNMHKPGADCNDLIEKTAAALSSEELQQLFVSAQQNNVELCVTYGVRRVMNSAESMSLKYFEKNKGDWAYFVSIVLTYFPHWVSVAFDTDY